MGRGKRNTQQVVCRIDCNIIEKLKSINPSLLTRDSVSGMLKFRHGALGKYIQRLIQEDIEKRQDQHPVDILEQIKEEMEETKGVEDGTTEDSAGSLEERPQDHVY
jgi:hypothetical protein